MIKIDVAKGSDVGLAAGTIAIRISGMAPQPAGVTVTPNAGVTDADFFISSEKYVYAVSHIGQGGETSPYIAAEATVQTRRKKVVIDFTDTAAGITTRIYRKKSTDAQFTEFTETTSNTNFTDDGTQIWTKTLEQPKDKGVVARSYDAIKKSDTFSVTKRENPAGNWQLILSDKNYEDRLYTVINLVEVANQPTWLNTSAGADAAITAINAY